MQHTPQGRGHAYRPSLDQRIPVVPAIGDSVEVRALVDDEVDGAWLEVRTPDGAVTRHPASATNGATAQPVANDHAGVDCAGDDDPGMVADDGHLAAAAAAGEVVVGMRSVAVTLPALHDRLEYRWCARDEATEWFDLVPATWQVAAGTLDLDAPAFVHDRLDATVEWLVDGTGARRCRFRLALVDDEHVLGLGERFHALDHRGRAIDTIVFEQYKSQNERTYLPVPFALVVGGTQSWGMHVDTTRRCWFDVGASTPDQLVVDVAVDPGDPVVAVSGFVGEPRHVLDQFLDATARPAPVPRWVFRPWMSSNEWNTQDRVLSEVQRSLDEDIPVGAIVIEAWADEATFTTFRGAQYVPRPDGGPMRLADFTFPSEGAWPDPVGMVKWLHDNDVRVLLWQIPVLPDDVPADRHGAEQLAHDRAALVRLGHAVREEGGSPYRNRGWWFPGGMLPDFTSPAATAWWVAKRRWLVEDLGIDGFKTDGGEHAWGDELRYWDKTRGDATNNRYPNLYASAYRDLLADCGRQGVTFSRAGFTGAGSLPCHWAGDEDSTWDAYRASITAGLSAGISGVHAWGWDLAGFSGEVPSAELYLRAAAMAMLCPIMQYHSEFNDHRSPSRDRTPWNIAERSGDPTVLSVYRSFAQLRERLVDHIANQYEKGIQSGMPLMRALPLLFPRHDQVWHHPYQYMLGDHLLVAPVTEPAVSTWPVWLPPGQWVDAWTGEFHPGDQLIDVEAPLDRIPVFIAAPASSDMRSAFAPDAA